MSDMALTELKATMKSQNLSFCGQKTEKTEKDDSKEVYTSTL